MMTPMNLLRGDHCNGAVSAVALTKGDRSCFQHHSLELKCNLRPSPYHPLEFGEPSINNRKYTKAVSIRQLAYYIVKLIIIH